MNTHADKTEENKSRSAANADSQKQNGGKSEFQFVDNRPEAIAQRKLQELANNSPQAKQAAQLQAMPDNSLQANRLSQIRNNNSASTKRVIQRNQDYKEKQGANTMSINDSKFGYITATTQTEEGKKFSTLHYKEGDNEKEWIISEIHSNLRGHGGALMYHLCLLAEKAGVKELHATNTAVEAYSSYNKWGFAPSSEGVSEYLRLGITNPDQIRVADWYAKVSTVKSVTETSLFEYWDKKGCFLTSACVEYMGLPDDCIELSTLREFRDGYLMSTFIGKNLVSEYYKIAPDIVRAINHSTNALLLYKNIHKCVLLCVSAIQQDRPDIAMQVYNQMVLILKTAYLAARMKWGQVYC